MISSSFIQETAAEAFNSSPRRRGLVMSRRVLRPGLSAMFTIDANVFCWVPGSDGVFPSLSKLIGRLAFCVRQ